MYSVRLLGPAEVSISLSSLPREPRHDEVEVRLELAGLCGSDKPGFLTGMDASGERPPGFPLHECLGTVVRAGDSGWVGKRVIAIPYDDAGLSEHFLAPAERTYALRSDLPAAIAILTQPLATVLAALDRLGDLRGKRVAVLGLGPIGLTFGFMIRHLGVASLVGFDRRDRSQAPFADVFDSVGCGPVPADAFDVVIDAVGHDQGVVSEAIEAAAYRGTVLCFGVPDEEFYRIPFQRFFRKCLNLVANVQPPWQEYLRQAEDYLVSYPELGALVTDIFPVSRVQEAYEAAFVSDGKGRGKILIEVDQWLGSAGASQAT